MSDQNYIDELKAAEQQQREEAIADYKALVRSIDQGTKPDHQHAAAVLAAAGKSHADLSADLKLLQDRRRWADKVKSEQTALAEHRQIAEDKKANEEEYAAAGRRARQAGEALADRRRKVDQLLQEIQEAKRNLIKTCQDEALLAELQQAEYACRTIGEELQAVSQNRGRKRHQKEAEWEQIRQEVLSEKRHLEELRDQVLERMVQQA
jgi:hypothetical protein